MRILRAEVISISELQWVNQRMRLSASSASSSQKTVPSDKIMIGGSFVFGRDTSASSRPPWLEVSTVYESLTCIAYLPRPSFKHLCEREAFRTEQT
jgi:hypothetical protein